jgi:putative ABC transport system permease protein
MTGDAALVAATIRAQVRAIDPRVTVQRIGTVDHLFAESDPLGSSRSYAVLLGGLAGLGLLTSSVGLYGLMSFAVRQRTHEIRVRIAHDPTTFGAIVALLVIVCGLTVFVPVRRATHIDPVDALRDE